MKKYKYMICSSPFLKSDEEWLNELGQEGWELVAVKDWMGMESYIFKKEIK